VFKTKIFLWCILEADQKAFFIFGSKRKCRRKWNSIYGRKWNKNKNGHSFSAEKRKRKSPDNISVFFLFIHSVTKSALQCTTNISSSFAFFAGGPCWWDSIFLMYSVQISLWHFSRWHFNPRAVCFPGLLLPSESNFLQSMHCALLASVWPNKYPPLLNTLSTEADVHRAQKVHSNNGFRMANCFCCLSQNAMVCLAHCRQELQQKSWKTARLFLQDRDQDQMFKTTTKTSWSKNKTKTFIFVLEAPRDQD